MVDELRVGDLAVTTHKLAGTGDGEDKLGEGKIVQIVDAALTNDCYGVHRFPFGTRRIFVHLNWLKLYWRPDAD